MTSEERQAKIEDRRKRLRARELNDISKILQIPEGRRFMWRLLESAQIFRLSNKDNPEEAGRRNLGLPILEDVFLTDPDRFLQMQREYRSEQESLKAEIPDATGEDA